MQAFRIGLLLLNFVAFFFYNARTSDLPAISQSLTRAHEIAGVIILLSTHWIGCIFYFLARLRSFDDSTWVAAQEKNIPFYQVSTSNMLSDYILCIYKGFNVLTAVGYDGLI